MSAPSGTLYVTTRNHLSSLRISLVFTQSKEQLVQLKHLNTNHAWYCSSFFFFPPVLTTIVQRLGSHIFLTFFDNHPAQRNSCDLSESVPTSPDLFVGHSVRKSQFYSRGFSTLRNLILFTIRFVKSLQFVISMRNTIHKIFEIYEILRFMKSVKSLNSSLYPAIFHCWLSQLLIIVRLNFRIFMEIMKEVNSWIGGAIVRKS